MEPQCKRLGKVWVKLLRRGPKGELRIDHIRHRNGLRSEGDGKRRAEQSFCYAHVHKEHPRGTLVREHGDQAGPAAILAHATPCPPCIGGHLFGEGYCEGAPRPAIGHQCGHDFGISQTHAWTQPQLGWTEADGISHQWVGSSASVCKAVVSWREGYNFSVVPCGHIQKSADLSLCAQGSTRAVRDITVRTRRSILLRREKPVSGSLVLTGNGDSQGWEGVYSGGGSRMAAAQRLTSRQ